MAVSGAQAWWLSLMAPATTVLMGPAILQTHISTLASENYSGNMVSGPAILQTHISPLESENYSANMVSGPQAWWLSLMAPATTVLVGLAILMTDIMPYAAFPNDIMSSLGWFPHYAKDPVTGSLGCKLAILKAYYESEPSPR
jgi:hypothetical protein